MKIKECQLKIFLKISEIENQKSKIEDLLVSPGSIPVKIIV
jgi:hypothetical protein